MLPVSKQLGNPLTRNRDVRDRQLITALFPDLTAFPEARFLALRPYVRKCPERFFDEEAYRFYRDWLAQRDSSQRMDLISYFADNEQEINRALLFLREINAEEWHDNPLESRDDFGVLRLIDSTIHPTYLRLVEAVLIPMVRPVAYFSRIDRGKGTEGLDVWSVVQELTGTPAECLVRAYNHLVRNGIAHGGITYLQNDIRYRDKKVNEETLHTSTVIRLCDNLIDACNGIAAALKVFWVVSRDAGYKPPQEFLLEELQEETRSPWWSIVGCVEAEIGPKRQLLIYARPESRDVAKVQWSTIQSGILAEFFAPGYDRYFFSLRSPKAWPGWAGFDGQRLRELREIGASDLGQYQGIVEGGLIFYVPQPALPKIFRKWDTLWQSMRLQWPLTLEEIRVQRGIPQMVCRNAKIHRNAWGSVLNGDLVLHEDDNDAVELVRSNRRRIVKYALKSARSVTSRLEITRHLPLGFARIAVFGKDYRRRRLSGFGLGSDLICTVQFQRIGRIRTPDLMGSTVEVHGRWRIAWNKRWLESTGASLTPSK